MSWYHWFIVVVPVAFVIAMAVYSHRYAKSVADYLVAGRVAGRYVLSAAGLMDGLAVISLIASVEANYKTGFAMGYWYNLLLPLGLFMGLFGYVSYRFRQTRAMSGGQYLEMRYNRAFRVFATIMRVFGEMLANCIGPAVAARFFIYLLGIPHRTTLLGWTIPTFPLLLVVCISLAMVVILSGGRIALIVADSIQGIISYPIFLILVVFVATEFSWSGQIAAVAADRVPGESFLNPYDVQGLRDFNMFALVLTVFNQFFGWRAWIGNDHSGVGRTPHEQKMAGILGNWRGGFAYMMVTLLVLSVITVMNHKDFAGTADTIRHELSARVVDEIARGDDAVLVPAVGDRLAAMGPQIHEIGVDAPLSQDKNLDTTYQEAVHETFKKTLPDQEDHANQLFQNFRALYNQMMAPVMMRHFFPPVLMALFVMLMILMMISTDDSRIFNSASALVQDLILPFCRKPPSPRAHLFLIKAFTVLVCVIFFFASIFLSQLDYINLFMTISCSIWVAGGGVVVVLGLYWRRGTTAGAFASLIAGGGISLAGMMIQRSWADGFLPWLVRHGWDTGFRHFLEAASRPFNPWIDWKVSDALWPVKFPVNATEISFIAALAALVAYIVVSLVTCRTPFDLDRLLHRGKWAIEDDAGPAAVAPAAKPLWKRILDALIDITPEYTLGDKILAWSVFIYSVVYQFFLAFLCVVIWHLCAKYGYCSPWSVQGWSNYFYVTNIAVPSVSGVITTVWFMWGGIKDIRALFQALETRKRNALDNGMVEGHVSLADKAAFSAAMSGEGPDAG